MANLELKTASGGSVTLVPQDGGGNFSVNIKNADGTLLLNEDFDQKSLTANGYQILPSGLIIQWGNATASGGSFSTISFPIAFPTALRSISGNWSTASYVSAFKGTVIFDSGNTSTVKIGVTDSSGNFSVRWIALGY